MSKTILKEYSMENLDFEQKLKNEINSLVDRISLKIKNENVILKAHVTALKSENERLVKLLNEDNRIESIRYFQKKSQTIIN